MRSNMRYKFKTIISIILIILSIVSFCGCSFQNLNNKDGADSFDIKYQDGESVKVDISNNDNYQTVPVENVKLMDGFPTTDGKYNYFCFKLGEIHNIPMYSENAYEHEGLTECVYEWSETEINSEIYSKLQSNCITHSISTSLKESATKSNSVSLSASYKGITAGVNGVQNKVFEAAIKDETVSSSINNFVNSVSSTIEKSHSRTITISKDSPKGFYKYIIYGNVDVYVAVTCDIQKKTIEYSYIISPKIETLVDGLKYSPDNNYGFDQNIKLELSEDALSDQPLFDIDIKNKTYNYVYCEEKLIFDCNFRVTDNGEYGLEQPNASCELDLSSMSKYMNDDYVFKFDFQIKSESCKYIIGGYMDGYHEMYMYNKDPGKVDNSYKLCEDEIIEMGYINSFEWVRAEIGDDECTWSVSGERCASKMYLRFDADGYNEDDWYLHRIRVNVSVTKKK